MKTDKLIWRAHMKLENGRTHVIEEWCRLCIKPCPKWMPEVTYRFLLRELIYMEQFKP